MTSVRIARRRMGTCVARTPLTVFSLITSFVSGSEHLEDAMGRRHRGSVLPVDLLRVGSVLPFER